MVTKTATEFMVKYSMRNPRNVTHWNYPPLFRDSLLKDLSTREFKKELKKLKTSTQAFLDTADIAKDSIFVYEGK